MTQSKSYSFEYSNPRGENTAKSLVLKLAGLWNCKSEH